jgi:nucleotide-binding universal stress UspA family protein
MEAEARELAEESVTLLRARGVTARGIVARGEIVAAILQCIEDEQADLVILGRRGLTAEIRAAHPVLGVLRATDSGSVADKVARHATAPVLLVG